MDFDSILYFLFATLLLFIGVALGTCWLWADSSNMEIAEKIVAGVFSGIMSIICICYAIYLYREEVFV
jgi:hypothetical protein